MKRWILARAGKPDLAPVVQRAKRKGPIGASPMWVDTWDSADYYAKQVRTGYIAVLMEADERPAPTPQPQEPVPPPGDSESDTTEDREDNSKGSSKKKEKSR